MAATFTLDNLIGRTPLIDLSSLVDGKATILGKYEATNPGGSVKDRVAKAMIDAAERDGLLAEGGTIIEPTSGNTGVGLAMLAAARGYKMILVMPETMSVERRKLAASYGAEIVLTPGSEGMGGAVRRAEELRAEIAGSIIAGQFDNPANPQVHYDTTGPEIFEATAGAASPAARATSRSRSRRCGRSPSSRPSRRCSPAGPRARTASRASALASCRRTTTPP